MTTETRIEVPEIHCDHCKHSIETAVGRLGGVEAVAVDIDARTVEVRHDETTATEDIYSAIEGQGYEVPR